ncbi:MAG: DUF1573 domain-containing protein [Bacteroidaceae bacterium]|nr:DUF1573 domain-containing protein [Bacteroidaceae bacterium]
MKKFLILFTVLFAFTSFALAQDKQPGKKQAEIKFDQTLYDFGRFPETAPMQTCKFYFTNTGNDLLIIHQAVASCGCTVPKYPKEPIRPGERGSITVTYNGTGKAPGVFKKSVTLRTNAKTELVRLYIMGEMEEK